MGNYFLDQLRGLQLKYPFILDVRGLGLMDAIELDSRERRDQIYKGSYARSSSLGLRVQSECVSSHPWMCGGAKSGERY